MHIISNFHLLMDPSYGSILAFDKHSHRINEIKQTFTLTATGRMLCSEVAFRREWNIALTLLCLDRKTSSQYKSLLGGTNETKVVHQ